MEHAVWSKEVRKALIDREETISQMAVHIGVAPETARTSIYGRYISPKTVKLINEYLGIEGYEGESK